MRYGGEPGDILVSLDRVPVAGQTTIGVSDRYLRLEGQTFQKLVGEPIEARDIISERRGSQSFMGQVAAGLEWDVQGKRAAGVASQNLPVEVLLSGLSGADKAEWNGSAFSMVLPVGQGRCLDHVFQVLSA